MKYDTYEDYLLSGEWQRVKNNYIEFTEYDISICFLCYRQDELQCHHWRYPKDWDNDSYKNLILVCDQCHETAHAIQTDKMLHNSSLFPDNSYKSLVRYLSWMIKATGAMESAYFERLSNEF